MKSGDRIGADWRLLVEVGPTLGVCRWRATAGDGTPVEILSPRVEGAMRPAEVRERFVSLHRAVRDAHDPALVRVHEVIQSTTGVWVVRDPLEDATLNDLQGPLDAEAVATIGVALLPAILSLTGALRGVLLGEDIGLDATGRPILAPRGPHDNRVTQAVAGAVPPEVFAGAIPDGRAALYGLGALLYRLAAGRVPPPQQHPPPPASAWNHTVPAALDRALALLLSTDPDQRASALQPDADVRSDRGPAVGRASPAARRRGKYRSRSVRYVAPPRGADRHHCRP